MVAFWAYVLRDRGKKNHIFKVLLVGWYAILFIYVRAHVNVGLSAKS